MCTKGSHDLDADCRAVSHVVCGLLSRTQTLLSSDQALLSTEACMTKPLLTGAVGGSRDEL